MLTPEPSNRYDPNAIAVRLWHGTEWQPGGARTLAGYLSRFNAVAYQDEGIFTLAIVHAEGGYEPNPPSDRPLAPGESLIASGSTEVLAALRARA